jgi:hypothetical protein
VWGSTPLRRPIKINFQYAKEKFHGKWNYIIKTPLANMKVVSMCRLTVALPEELAVVLSTVPDEDFRVVISALTLGCPGRADNICNPGAAG